MRKIITIAFCMLLVLSCGRKKAASDGSGHVNFPFVEVPSLLDEPSEALSYSVEHFWDKFFSLKGVTDTSAILGVGKVEVEQTLGVFLQMCSGCSKAQAQKGIGRMFAKLEECQRADTSSHVYLLMTEMVSKYLYDPNSPLRDEDLYLPFVRGMAASEFTPEAVRPGYVFEERMCSLNTFGGPAADFTFRDASGRSGSLYGIKADYTLLFFSNPGCTACKEIIDALVSRPYLDDIISSGRLAVASIYIDEDLVKWREYVPLYPGNWIVGYDNRNIIRQDAIYNVRAIPSLYLLDAQKKVILKDATTEKVIAFLDNINGI